MGIFNSRYEFFLFQPNSMLAIWLFIARSLLPYNPVINSLYKILMESTCHQVNLDFIRSPSGVWGLYQDVWGSVTYSPGSEIVGLHISNMPNKMLWHTKHIAYISMVQKSLVCTCQTCQIKLMGVGHCFVWCYGYSIFHILLIPSFLHKPLL